MANRRGKLSILIEAKNLAGKAFLEVKSQARSASQSVSTGFGRAREGLAKFGSAMTGLIAGFATFAALRIGRELFKIGSAAVETASKFGTVFGPELERMNRFLDENAAKMGASRAEMQDLLATTGAMVQGIGATVEQSAAFSEQITVLSGDLASFNNVQGGAADVSQRITKALLGERESLKQLGIAVQESEVQQRALNLARANGRTEATALEKAEATLTIITEKAAVAVGDLDRTQNSAANRARRLSAELRTVRETIAVAVLPIFDKLLETVDSIDFLRFAAALETDVGEAFRNLGIIAGARLGQGIFEGLEKSSRAINFLGKIPGVGKLFDSINLFALGSGKIAEIARDSADQASEAISILANAEGSLGNVTAAIQAARDRLAGGVDIGGAQTDDPAGDIDKIREAGKATANALEAVQAKAALLGDSFDAPAERARVLRNAVEAFTEAGLEANDVIPGLDMTLGQLAFRYGEVTGEIQGAENRQRAFNDVQKLVGDLLDGSMTAADRYREQVALLSVGLEAGFISQQRFNEAVAAARDEMERSGRDAADLAGRTGNDIGAALTSGLESGVEDLAGALGAALAGVPGEMQGFSKLTLNIIGGLLQQMGAATVGFGKIGVALRNLLSNPFAAIAVGIAAIALGSAIKSTVSSQVSSAGSALAAGGGSVAGGGTPTAGAGINRDLTGQQSGPVFLQIVGGSLLDMSDPKTERSLREAMQELAGRRVIITNDRSFGA